VRRALGPSQTQKAGVMPFTQLSPTGDSQVWAVSSPFQGGIFQQLLSSR
jgi:hypothetical protein